MILSDIYGDCHEQEFDLIVRGGRDQVKHELMHVLINMEPEDVMEVIELWLMHLKMDLEEKMNEETN